MTGGRGAHQTPGEFRRTQNWIGGTRPGTARFVPPPPHELLRVLGDLEHFIVEGNATPIIKAGLAHAQFETIHPFLDGELVVGSVRGAATLRVYEEVQRRVIVSIRRVSETLGISIPTVTSSLRRLEDLGIVRETTGRRYARMFAYRRQLEILNETKDIGSSDPRPPTREDVWIEGFNRQG